MWYFDQVEVWNGKFLQGHFLELYFISFHVYFCSKSQAQMLRSLPYIILFHSKLTYTYLQIWRMKISPMKCHASYS